MIKGSKAVKPQTHSYIFPVGDCVAIPFMVREPHHERNCLIGNSNTYPFALSASKALRANCDTVSRGERREGLTLDEKKKFFSDFGF
jgi:hypothetical protein